MSRKSRDPFAELAPETAEEEAPESDERPTEQAPDEPPPVLGIGLHPGISEAHYHADPCERPSLSASCAHTIVTKSEAHAYDEHPRLGSSGKRRHTKEMDFGSLVHLLTLGGQAEIVEVSADDWKKKADQATRKAARAAGRIPVLSRELERAHRLVDKIAQAYPLCPGLREVTLVWEQPVPESFLRSGETLAAPVLCRGRLDHLDLAEDHTSAVVTDLKIWNSAETSDLERALVDYGADIQAEAYSSAICLLFPETQGRVAFIDLVVEESTGYVNPCGYGGSMAELGGLRWGRGVYTWARCRDSNHWPAYATPGRLTYPQPKPWALSREQELSYGTRI